jgi:hypothetical protein
LLIIFQVRKNIKPFKNKGFEYFDKVAMIVGDSAARGGHAFHPSSAAPPANNDDDEGGGDEDLEYLDNTPIDPATVQALITSAVASASMTSGPTSPDMIPPSSIFPTLNDLIPFDDVMEVDPMAHQSPSSGLADGPVISRNKRKLSTSLPPPTTSLASSAASDSPSSSTHLVSHLSSNNLSVQRKRQKASSSSSAPATSLRPPSRKGKGPASQLSDFNVALDRMSDVMENQNLLFQVPLPRPADEAAQTRTRVIKAIQDDPSGLFTIQEKGRLINHVINNPSAAASYEVLNDDVRGFWLRSILDG